MMIYIGLSSGKYFSKNLKLFPEPCFVFQHFSLDTKSSNCIFKTFFFTKYRLVHALTNLLF